MSCKHNVKASRGRSASKVIVLIWSILTISPPNGTAPAAQAQHRARPNPSAQRAIPGSAILKKLAAQAKRRSTELRRYAESASSPEQKGRAYLVLGYSEFESNQYVRGAADLGRAAATGFSLADFAAYYQGEAAQAAQQPGQVVQALQDFSARYPQSFLRYKALNLLGQALLKANQPGSVIELLAKIRKLHGSPALQLLLARALWQAQRNDEAARAFEEVYYNFPSSPEADIASGALRNLQGQLGASFPAATLDQRQTRAELLFKAARWDAALKEYEALLQSELSSAQADNWKVRRARCLVYLRRAQQALDSLAVGDWSKSLADPDRLTTLVSAYEQVNNQPQMFQALDDLAKRYSQSSAYAEALWSVGISSCAGRTGNQRRNITSPWPLLSRTMRTPARRDGGSHGATTSRARRSRRGRPFWITSHAIPVRRTPPRRYIGWAD